MIEAEAIPTGTDDLVEKKAKRSLESLSVDIQSDIETLRQDASDNKVTEYIERELQLGRQGKLQLLYDFLNTIGESIASFKALHDKSEQEESVKNIEILFNIYMDEDAKKAAKKNIENILG